MFVEGLGAVGEANNKVLRTKNPFWILRLSLALKNSAGQTGLPDAIRRLGQADIRKRTSYRYSPRRDL